MKVSKNTAAGKGIRTGLQSAVGSLVTLAVALWAVPGVPDVVTSFVLENWFPILTSIGGLSGIASWVQNRIEERTRG